MNKRGVTQAAPGWGNLTSPVVIVGQSLCGPCMAAQEPFVGGSADLLEAGFDLADLEKRDLYITNVVHCHPEGNKKSTREWKANCTPYLGEELRLVGPKLIIGLGNDAKDAIREFYPDAPNMLWPFRTPRAEPSNALPRVHFVRHPSSIKREHSDALERKYSASLARALRWGFQPERTCKGDNDWMLYEES
ncbi:uracil-DNA glycosylase family protein [Mycobacterium sp. 29Ha]|uniref:uracil-DNA glycosylase family protein n=1 Tax=Mycobacterium sp. 29Ha TaxID=2939268 RepID=UPI00293939C6|nr:uracil-DNA glycosylase family protein [Mycobacterium sp. 29Ha]MDV3135973.1 uracil-DNA glycosylase [Mycobacterium sp. 29Ha]